MNKMITFLLLICVTIPVTANEKQKGILKVSTWECNETEVRELITEAFWDIIESPTTISMEGYMEVMLKDNQIITNELCYAAIYFELSGEKLSITAIPFKYIGSERVQINVKSVNRGIFAIIEGVGKALDYPYEMKNCDLLTQKLLVPW